MAITNTLAGRNIGMFRLAIWLILTGLLPLLNVRVSTTVFCVDEESTSRVDVFSRRTA